VRQNAPPLRIVIEPTESRRKWSARLDDRVLCVRAWPFVRSARLLSTEGHPADAVIEMWRPNTDEWALRGRLGAVAATVIDGETASRRAKNGVPIRFPGMAATPKPAGLLCKQRSCLGVFPNQREAMRALPAVAS
jgi:hypothetical protein